MTVEGKSTPPLPSTLKKSNSYQVVFDNSVQLLYRTQHSHTCYTAELQDAHDTVWHTQLLICCPGLLPDAAGTRPAYHSKKSYYDTSVKKTPKLRMV